MKIIKIYVVCFIMLLLVACDKNSTDKLIDDDVDVLNYSIEQVLYSKSFQSIDSNVVIIDRNDETTRLNATLGISQAININVDNILRNGSNIEIHVSGKEDKNHSELSVPQIILDLETEKLPSSDLISFSIVYDKMKTYKVKFNLEDIINSIETRLKLASKIIPSAKLVKDNELFYWIITYNEIIDKNDPTLPLISLKTKVDANSGEMLGIQKISLANRFSEGEIVAFSPNDIAIIKKTIKKNDSTKATELWVGNLFTNTTDRIFTTNYDISSIQLSQDNSRVSFLEHHNDVKSLFLIDLADHKAYKPLIDELKAPYKTQWLNGNRILLFEDALGKRDIYNYNCDTKILKLLTTINIDVEDIIIKNKLSLTTKASGDKNNLYMFLSTDYKNYELLGAGYSPKFFGSDHVVSLNRNEVLNKIDLNLYDINSKALVKTIDTDIINYTVSDDKLLVYQKKEAYSSKNSINLYNLETGKITKLTNFVGDKYFYDPARSVIYANLFVNMNNVDQDLIYYKKVPSP